MCGGGNKGYFIFPAAALVQPGIIFRICYNCPWPALWQPQTIPGESFFLSEPSGRELHEVTVEPCASWILFMTVTWNFQLLSVPSVS